MNNNEQGQGGLGKGLMRLIVKNKIILLIIITIITGLLFYNTYSNVKDREKVNDDKQAFLNELSGVSDSNVEKENEKTNKVSISNNVGEEIQFSNIPNVQNTSMVEKPIIIQENDYYKIEVVGAQTNEEQIIINIKYQVKENPSDSDEIDNDLIYLSTSKTYLATSSGNLPLQVITGVGLLPLEYNMENYGKKDFNGFKAYIANISSESRIPTSFELQGTFIFKRPENYITDDNCKIKIVSMPLAINKAFDDNLSGSYDQYKDKLLAKPYPWYYRDFIFEDMLTVSFETKE